MGLAAIFGAFRYAAMVKPDRRSWFAPPPGHLDDQQRLAQRPRQSLKSRKRRSRRRAKGPAFGESRSMHLTSRAMDKMSSSQRRHLARSEQFHAERSPAIRDAGEQTSTQADVARRATRGPAGDLPEPPAQDMPDEFPPCSKGSTPSRRHARLTDGRLGKLPADRAAAERAPSSLQRELLTRIGRRC